MASEKFEINAFQEALGELINADGQEEMAGVVAGNPVLLSGEADAASDLFINAAKTWGDENSANGQYHS